MLKYIFKNFQTFKNIVNQAKVVPLYTFADKKGGSAGNDGKDDASSKRPKVLFGGEA